MLGGFTLGIGLYHEPTVAQLGIDFVKPIRHLREYLQVLVPLLETGEVAFDGELYRSEDRFFNHQPGQCRCW